MTVVECADIYLDIKRRVIVCAGSEYVIKPTSSRLLALLIQRAGSIVSREEIFRQVWGCEFDPGTKRLEVQVHLLRGSLRRMHSELEIKTYRGRGICLSLTKPKAL